MTDRQPSTTSGREPIALERASGSQLLGQIVYSEESFFSSVGPSHGYGALPPNNAMKLTSVQPGEGLHAFTRAR
jgi:hypothetical protein